MQSAETFQAALLAIFEHWHAQYREPISRSIASMLREQSLVEDLTQETFLRLWRALETKGMIDHPQAYLYRIAANLCCDYARRQRLIHWQPLPEEERLDQGLFLDPQDQCEVREQVRQTLERLPERYRAALLLYEQGYSYAQLAQALSISPLAVKMFLSRARRRFRQCYTDLL